MGRLPIVLTYGIGFKCSDCRLLILAKLFFILHSALSSEFSILKKALAFLPFVPSTGKIISGGNPEKVSISGFPVVKMVKIQSILILMLLYCRIFIIVTNMLQGSLLPIANHKLRKVTSAISDELILGPSIVLNDAVSNIAVNEAFGWKKFNPFSPLMDGECIEML